MRCLTGFFQTGNSCYLALITMELRSTIQHLFQQSSLDEVSVDTLRSFCNQQPYFAIGQLLLLKKLTQANHPDAQTQFQKTAIYFDNPLWLRQLMTDSQQVSENGFSAIGR